MQDVQTLRAEYKEFRHGLRGLVEIVRQLKYEQQRDRTAYFTSKLDRRHVVWRKP